MNTPKRRDSAHRAILAAKNLARERMATDASLRRQKALDDVAFACGHENWNRFSGFFLANPAADVPDALSGHAEDVPVQQHDSMTADPRDFTFFYGEPARSGFLSVENQDGTRTSLDLRPGYLIRPGRVCPAGIRMKHSVSFMGRQDFERSLPEICAWIGLPLLAKIETEEEFRNFLGSIESEDFEIYGDGEVASKGISHLLRSKKFSYKGKTSPGIVVLPWNLTHLAEIEILFAQARSLGVHLILPLKPGNKDAAKIWDQCESLIFRSPDGLKVAHNDPSHYGSFLKPGKARLFSPHQAATIFKRSRECVFCVWSPEGGYPVDFGVRKIGALILSALDVEIARERLGLASSGTSLTLYARDVHLVASFGVVEGPRLGDSVISEVRQRAFTSVMGFEANSHEEADLKARRFLEDPSANVVTVKSGLVYHEGKTDIEKCDIRFPASSFMRAVSKMVG